MIQGRDGAIYGAFLDIELRAGVNAGAVLRFDEQPTIAAIVGNGAEATLTWRSFTNRLYRLEGKASADAGWTDSGLNILSQGDNTSVTVPSLGDERYYRIVLLP